MSRAFQSELLKLSNRRITWVMFILVGLASFAFGLLPALFDKHIALPVDVESSWGVGAFGFVMILLFASAATGYEYKSRVIGTLITRAPSRGSLLVAKIGGLAVFAVGLALWIGLFLVLGWLISGLLGQVTVVDNWHDEADGVMHGGWFAATAAEMWGSFWRTAFGFVCTAVAGVTIATVTRSTAFSIIVGLLTLLFVEPAITAVVLLIDDDFGGVPLFFHALGVITVDPTDPGEQGAAGMLSFSQAMVTVTVWVAAMLATTFAVLQRRDVR